MLSTEKIEKLVGHISMPGDKSISHRAIMLLSISRGKGEIEGFLLGDDCLNTIRCFRKLGVTIEKEDRKIIVYGKGLHGLKKPLNELDAGNSGTTMRLISGILAGQSFKSVVTGDSSLIKRPMARIIRPLQMMGADIAGTNEKDLAPLVIYGQKLTGIDYTLPVASAQVKSAILLAGLYATGQTIVREPSRTRDHTELMLGSLGANIHQFAGQIIIKSSELHADQIQVPGDFSSAAYFLGAAATLPGSHLTIKGVGLNPTRTGLIDVLKSMAASIELANISCNGGEIKGDLIIKGKELQGTTVSPEIIPSLIDEIPILAAVASQAEGITTITGAEELRVKESNRLNALVTEFTKLGIDICELPDGLKIKGPNKIKGAIVESYGDHRMAMTLAILGLFSDDPIKIKDSACINVSFPGFGKTLQQLTR